MAAAKANLARVLSKSCFLVLVFFLTTFSASLSSSLVHASEPRTPPVVQIDVDRSEILGGPFRDQWLSFNIDTASLYYNVSILDPKLLNLAKALTPARLRLGGGTADSTLFVAGEDRRGGFNNTLYLNNEYFAEVIEFQKQTGFEMFFDVNLHVRNNDANLTWDSSNFTALLDFIVASDAQGMSMSPYGWQLGNEEQFYPGQSNVTAGQMAQDFQTMRTILSEYAERYPNVAFSQIITGPSMAGLYEFESWAQEFLDNLNPGILSAFTFHTYTINFPCNLSRYIDPLNYDASIPQLTERIRQWREYAEPRLGPIEFWVGETASGYSGGCDGFANRYVSGFWYINQLGLSATLNISEVHRQDIMGFSNLGSEGSSYALAGPPGWTSNDSLLTPHPDYFTSILFKQLVGEGSLSLNLTIVNPPDNSTNFRSYAYCLRGSGTHSLVVSYLNLYNMSLSLDLSMLSETISGSAYIFTSVESGLDAVIPSDLVSDSLYLNGNLLAVDDEGLLPPNPFPAVPLANFPTLPPFSYGFLVLNDFGLPC